MTLTNDGKPVNSKLGWEKGRPWCFNARSSANPARCQGFWDHLCEQCPNRNQEEGKTRREDDDA